MYAIIMGGGRVGLALANLLIDNGFDITLIESDESLCNEVAAELDALVICGNGTSSKLLEETNIEDADFFIATTGNDEANLLSCILVRKYDVETIIARVSNPDHEEAFKEIGIDRVISPEISAHSRRRRWRSEPRRLPERAWGTAAAGPASALPGSSPGHYRSPRPGPSRVTNPLWASNDTGLTRCPQG